VLVEWHVTQALSNPSATARRGEYGVFGTPVVWFDGVDSYDSSDSAYVNYRHRLETRLAVGSPVSIGAELEVDAGASTGEVRATITLAAGEVIANPADHLVRVAILEDDVAFCCDPEGGSSFQHVGRLLSPGEPLTLSGASPIQQTAWTFAVASGWSVANLRAAVFVEHDPTNDILNAARATIVDPSSVKDTTWGRAKAAYR
jgi:hypothetical protein